ncbi:MAG: LppX_LprAFG lipoprotein, partial [Anaerolineales bacterium]
PLPPEEIINRAVAQMKSSTGFHFAIDRSGAPAFLDPGETLSFRRAEGDYVAPDRASAVVRVIAPGLVAEVQVISIGDRYWETNVLTGEWQELPPDLAFNPATLFDPQTGLQPILESDLSDLTLAGVAELEESPGQPLYHVIGLLDAGRIYDLSFGLIGPGQVDAQLWIAPETFDVYRIEIVEPPAEGAEGSEETTTWQVDFWNFDKTVEILPPQ